MGNDHSPETQHTSNQGHLTPKYIVQSGPVSNLSNILYMFYFFTSFIKIGWKLHRLCSGQSRMCFFFFFGTQGQITQKWRVRYCWNLNSSAILCLSRLSATFIKIQSRPNRLCSGQGRIWVFFSTKGQVTPKSIVKSGRNSISFEILCLSRLSASLVNIQLKLNRLPLGQGWIWCFLALKGK